VTDPYGEDLSAYESSPRSRGVALVLAVALGVFGAHRFYAGRTASAVAMLCTLGGLGLWALYDAILIAGGDFIDGDGRRISKWDPTELDALPPGSNAELARMRQELDEMHERLDFAERLLARPSSPEGDR
jgi:hypothetical protein